MATTQWFQAYKNTIQSYVDLFMSEDDIGRSVTYRAFLSSAFNNNTGVQDFNYTEYAVRAIKIDAGAETIFGPLWIGIKNYRSQASGSIQTGDFQYMFLTTDFPSGFEPSSKDQIIDSGDTVKVMKADNVFNVAFIIVAEGSNVT